ncbi:16S rRNA (cytosine(1402)-N(4))-methyltransferase, partial [Buchnera aphidicola]|nr:16S rRNA (cytosine(1402)-N(4))-methyltransferase [Buchnera aphidicola]
KKYHTQKKINSTIELVNIIKKAIPVKNTFKHPARKTFQALRIYINQELEELKTGLTETLKILKPGGRIT